MLGSLAVKTIPYSIFFAVEAQVNEAYKERYSRDLRAVGLLRPASTQYKQFFL